MNQMNQTTAYNFYGRNKIMIHYLQSLMRNHHRRFIGKREKLEIIISYNC